MSEYLVRYLSKLRSNTCITRCLTCVVPQVLSLSPAPLSLLIKAAPILTDDMYGDIQPAAWELLLSVDEHMAAAAGQGFYGKQRLNTSR